MKLVSYSVSGKIRLGALIDDDFIVDLNRAHRELLSSHPDSAKGRRISRLLPAAMLPFLQAGKVPWNPLRRHCALSSGKA